MMIEYDESKSSESFRDPGSGEEASEKTSRLNLRDKADGAIVPMSDDGCGPVYDEAEICTFNPEGYGRFQAYKCSGAIFAAILVPLGVVSMGSPNIGVGLGPLFLIGCVGAGTLTFLMNVEQQKARDAHIFHDKQTAKRKNIKFGG
jgi:hypothetical protein